MKRTAQPKSPLTRKALAALREAVDKVVQQHRREGRPLAVWQDGKAVWISPDKPAVVRERPATYHVRSRSTRRTS